MIQKLALGLVLFTFLLPLRADELLENGDFSDGITHWRGNGRAPADYASDNPLQASDPFTSKGLIIPLRHTQWTKVQQDVHPKAGPGTLTVVFRLSQGLSFSTLPADYTGIPAQLGWGWLPFNGTPGSWMIDLTNEAGIVGTHAFVKAKPASNAPQTYVTKFHQLDRDGETLTLAFPPGDGIVVIVSISLSQ